MKAKLLTTFNNNMKHHEGLILRSLIALKLMYRHHINIVVLSDLNSYIETLCSPFNLQSILSILSPNDVKHINVNEYTAIAYENNTKSIEIIKSIGVTKIKKIQPIKRIKLEFKSHIYDSEFTYPDLKSILEVIPKNVKLHETIPEIY